MSDILEIELQLLKDDSTKSIKTTLKNGEEIILYSPKYVKLLENENTQLDRTITELERWLQSIIYEIEPMGCSINYNCEYDSEEDYINAMKEQSKLNTLKIIKDKIQKLKEKYK